MLLGTAAPLQVGGTGTVSTHCVYERELWDVCDGLGRLTIRTHPSAGVGGEISEEREGPEPGWML